MTAHLHPDVHVAAVGADLVFLDIGRDSYFCVPGASSALVLASDGETLEECEPWLLAQLSEGELLADEGSARSVRARWPLPDVGTRDLGPPGPATATLGVDVGWMIWAAARLYRHGHGGSLASLVDAARATGSPAQGGGRDEALDLARRCDELLPWVPFQGDCLFRSFLTLSVLRRRGVQADWIFGVQTWPFRAHCWLQLGDVVLNDAAERVSGYAPIFVT